MEEVRYISPVLEIPNTGLEAGKMEELRNRGYDFYDFKQKANGKTIVKLISDFPYTYNDDIEKRS